MATTVLPGAMPLWMLNDASTTEEKLDYLRRCRSGGIQALTLHCRAGNLIPYASVEWFEQVREIVLEGRRLGMEIWLYDEDPFPSGAAGGMVMRERPDLTARAMSYCAKPPELQEGDLWFISERPLAWVGLVPCQDNLQARDLSQHVGTIRNDWFMGEWDSRFYYVDVPPFPCPRGNALRQQYAMRVPEIPDGYELAAIIETNPGEDTSWDCFPDLLNFETFEVFRRLSLDKYAAYVGQFFGNTIPGMFTDEPKYFGWMPLTDDLFPQFRKQYGYDLESRLYQLFGEPLNERWERTRIDYREWLAQRFLSAFVRPYRQYCDAHNLELVGHLSPEDDPAMEAMSLGSLMPIMKTMSWPGTDVIVPLTGDEQAPSLNLGSLRASSVRSQLGGRYCMSETLALTEWDVTSRKCRQLLAWQKVLGIDRFFFHGFYTTNGGVQLQEAPPDYGPESSIFRGIGATNEWLKRLDRVTDGATESAPVAILNSLCSYYTQGTVGGSERHQAMREHGARLILHCLQAQVGIHLADEQDVAEGASRDGRLRIGQREYATLLVPDLDIVPEATLTVIRQAVDDGLRVVWFGGGPDRLRTTDRHLVALDGLPGEVLSEPFPDRAWCADALPVLVNLQGAQTPACYVRRFISQAGTTYLLAVNIGEESMALVIGGNDQRAWLPVEADGQTDLVDDGTAWQLPGGGVGLFYLAEPPAEPQDEPVRVRPAGEGRTFERVAPNRLRLQAVTVDRPDSEAVSLPFPQPYYSIYEDYQSNRELSGFLGPVPVESRAAQPNVRYTFGFSSRGLTEPVTLVLDPRCARGRLVILLDDEPLSDTLRFPLPHISPLRLELGKLADGDHKLSLAFTIDNAMEGLLSQITIEGDFHVELGEEGDTLVPVDDGPATRSWPDAGLPYYMGDGIYRWQETFTGGDLQQAWFLEIEDIIDSGELIVNGESLGCQAWQPFCWELEHLKSGDNQFELRVSSTAGNAYKLNYPQQPQGWLGEAWLLSKGRQEDR